MCIINNNIALEYIKMEELTTQLMILILLRFANLSEKQLRHDDCDDRMYMSTMDFYITYQTPSML